MLEHLAIECRSSGRVLQGVALRFGEVTQVGRIQETFAPGSVRALSPALLNLDHRRTQPLSTIDWQITDEAVELRAQLPEGQRYDEVLSRVRSGDLSGISVEFKAERDRFEGNLRTIEDAVLVGAAITDSPYYEGSTIEARSRLLDERIETRQAVATVSSEIPSNEPLACSCHSSSAGINLVEFVEGVIADAFEEAVRSNRDVLALYGNAKSGVIASTLRDTMRYRRQRRGTGLEIDIPDTTAGRDLLEIMEAAPVLARPVFDQSLSEFTEVGGVARYSSLHLRAILLGSSPDDRGWQPIRLADDVAEERSRRRMHLWL